MTPTLTTLAAQSHTRPIWLHLGQLFTGTEVLKDAHLLLTNQTILHASPDLPSPHLLANNQSTPDLTLPEYTALPPLIESHAHLFLDGAPVNFADRDAYLKLPPTEMLARARTRLPKYLQSGIAAIRDAGDKHHVGLTLSAEQKSLPHFPTSPLPHIDSPGPAIHHQGRYGSFMGEPLENHPSPEACVASRIAAGADRIKLLVSGIINFKEGKVTTPPQMSVAEVQALVKAAKAHGKQTFAHASGTDGVEHSIQGHVTTIEHGFFITTDQLTRMRDLQIAWVPTFAPVQLQIDRASDLGWDDTVVSHLKRIIDLHRTMLQKAHHLGVIILAGSDAGSCGVPHALGLLQELVHMEHAGLPPLATLRAATSAPAHTLNFPTPQGHLTQGSPARLILTPHNPLTSVSNLLKDKLTLLDGTPHPCPPNLPPEGL